MKRKNVFKILGLTFSCALAMAAITASAPKAVQASAEGEGKTVTNVEMLEGASVRLTNDSGNAFADKTGMRFTMFVSKAAVKAYQVAVEDENAYPEVGMYVAKASDLTDGKNLESDEGIAAVKADGSMTYGYVAMDFAKQTPTSEWSAGSQTITFASPVYVLNVVNELPDTMYGTELTANGYVKTTDGTVYGEPQTRTIANVASGVYAGYAGNATAQETLDGFINEVLTEENFAAPAETMTTKAWDTEDIKFTLPEIELKTTWSNSNDKVATVDEATGAVTRVGVGTTTISATIGSTTKTMNLTVNSNIVDAATEYDRYQIYPKNVGEWERGQTPTGNEQIGGNYEGGFARFDTKTKEQIYLGFTIPFAATDAAFTAAKAKYTHVSLYIAADWEGTTDDAAGLKISAHMANTEILASKYIENDNTWQKISIPIADFETWLGSNNANSTPYLGKIIIEGSSTNKAVTSVALYLGDMFFEVLPTKIVDAATEYNKYCINSSAVTVATKATGTEEIAGDYEGGIACNARQITSFNFGLNIPFAATDAAFTAVKAKYTHVSFYIAANWEGTAEQVNITYYKAHLLNLNSQIISTNNTWQKISVPIADFETWIGESNAGTTLYIGRIVVGVNTQGNPGLSAVTLYLGDMFFENL